jgi:GTP-binding protein HflX
MIVPRKYTQNMIELEEQEGFNAKALLVEPQLDKDDKRSTAARMSELSGLCDTLGLQIMRTFLVPIRTIRPGTLIGSGKIEELKQAADELGAGIIVFDFSLSPTMQMNLEKQTDLCVIDRQEVIIQIFADRAQTREAQIQVNLARLQYSLPRLSRRWTNLSQVRGGVRGGKGAGEKKLELDRRYVENQIIALKKELESVRCQRSTQRQNRMEDPVLKIAIVGYTNSGKSSLLNKLTSAQVLEENKLFATLDPVTRKIEFPDGSSALLTDTVGFISDLPHELIDSFRSTLEEAKLADILLIVCDATHPSLLECFQTTNKVLNDLGCQDKTRLVVLNKVDAITEETTLQVLRFESEAEKITGKPPLRISVKTGENIDELKSMLQDAIHQKRTLMDLHVPLSDHSVIAELRKYAEITSLEYKDQYVLIRCFILPYAEKQFRKYSV